MNFKAQADKLEEFLGQELSNTNLVLNLTDKITVYKNFKIKLSKKGDYALYRISGFELDRFNLKTTALLAAKMYDKNNFPGIAELKILDHIYYKNFLELAFFKHKYNKSKTIEQLDLYLARISVAESKVHYAKLQIANKFRVLF